jgi:hypothetical protein
MNRQMDIRKVWRKDLPSIGKYVRVMYVKDFTAWVRFEGSSKEYKMTRLALMKVSDEEYDKVVGRFEC